MKNDMWILSTSWVILGWDYCSRLFFITLSLQWALWSFATADANVPKVLKHLEEIFCFCCSAWENCAFPEKIWGQSSKRWALGGGARRFNDKHVTQNGNNQALLQTRRQSLGRVTQLWVTHTKTHVHSGTHVGVQQLASWCQARGELLKHFEASVHGEHWMFTC